MAKKVMKIKLSVSGLEALKRELIQMKADLSIQCEMLVKRLLDEGLQVASAKVGESPLGKHITLSVDSSKIPYGSKGVLLAKGAVKENEGYAPFSVLLAVEFGAGIFYNEIPNPKASDMGFGVGTFPGQIHAFEDTWFYFDEETQEWRPTHGVKATMPLYSAEAEIRTKVLSIAKQIF